jgi:hypothetical protein
LFLESGREFYFLHRHCIQTSSHQKGIGHCFAARKAAQAWKWPLDPQPVPSYSPNPICILICISLFPSFQDQVNLKCFFFVTFHNAVNMLLDSFYDARCVCMEHHVWTLKHTLCQG